MRATSSIIALSSLAATTLAFPFPHSSPPSSSSSSLAKRSSSSSLSSFPVASNTFNIVTSVPRPPSRKARLEKLKRLVASASGSGLNDTADSTTDFYGAGGDEDYIAEVTFAGNQSLYMVIDTGSSDLWVASTNFTCLDEDYNSIPQEDCFFGQQRYNSNASSSYKPYPFVTNFNITYGDGSTVAGTPGYETVQIGNLSVPNTTFSVIERALWAGDNVSSGLMGFAFPSITDIYNGTLVENDTSTNQDIYNPWFFQAVSQNLTAPYFSFVLNRPQNLSIAESNSSLSNPLGYLGLGGIPPNVSIQGETNVTVPVQKFDLTTGEPSDDANATAAFWAVDVDGFGFGGDGLILGSSNNQTVIDSGTTLMYIQSLLAEEYNSLITPLPTYDREYDIYFVDCSATAPDMTVTIGGTNFTISGKDQIVFNGLDELGQPECVSGVQPNDGLGGLLILGDVFLHNVVTVYHVDSTNPEISFIQRADY